MESRVIVDAVTPTPRSFTQATRARQKTPAEGETATPETPSLEALKESIRQYFPKQGRETRAIESGQQRAECITSLAGLQRAILRARGARARVRASTRGLASVRNRDHVDAGGHVVETSALRRLVYFRSRGVFVAQAGVTLRDLQAAAGAHGVSLTVNAREGVDTRSVGACFATGVLGGAGLNEGVFGDAVEEVSVVDSYGRLRVFSASLHADVFRSLRCSLGMFGVIYDVTVAVMPAWKACVSHSFARVGGLLAREGRALRALVGAQAGLDCVWFPYNSYGGGEWDPLEDLVWLRAQGEATARADASANGVPPRLRMLKLPQWLHVHAARLLAEGYGRFEAAHARDFVADAFRQSAWVLAKKKRVCTLADATDFEYFDGASSTQAVSIAVPVRVAAGALAHGARAGEPAHGADGWATVVAVLRAGVSALRAASQAGLHGMVATTRLSVRVVQSSDAVLSGNVTTGGCDMHAAVVRLEGVRNAVGWRGFARALLSDWVRMRRVHWFWHRDGVGILTREVVMCLQDVDEAVDAFVQAREEADVDDYGMFVDGGLDELAGGAFSRRFGAVCEEGRRQGSVWRRWQELDAFESGVVEGGTEVVGREDVVVGGVGESRRERGGKGCARRGGRKTDSSNTDSNTDAVVMISRSERMWSKVSVWLYFIVVLVVLLRAAIERITAN